MLNKLTGEIRIGEVVVGPRFTKSDFFTSRLYPETIHQDHNGYWRYALRPQKLDGDLFTVALYFQKDGRLEFVSLGILEDDHALSWSNWSREQQEHRKEMHDQWLKEHLGLPPYEYDWGGILSQYDPRSATSTITIRYLTVRAG